MAEKETLASLCTESIKLILHLRSTQDYGDPELLRRRIKDLLSDLESEARGAGIDSSDINGARFALVAFIDESISLSNWPQKNAWMAQPLQRELFTVFNAGEVFFERLNDFRRKPDDNHQVIEVYQLCLMLGFRGKYYLEPDKLRALMEEVYREIYGATKTKTVILSPSGHLDDGERKKKKSRVPLWVYPVAAVVIGIFMYFILSNPVSTQEKSLNKKLAETIEPNGGQ